ncbi:SRPBCC family protein [Actinokineospora xionganensis]|uniref:SRPBCC family protein n=1 Tax=Actinokineospora xionganensis TaxID=2684470 RepID=A0ABR7L714_9PSEU|nr:SRPBCC family protein [Actinokineospora xionganensis]MBC6448204.1 SRPBCC family protein [Actinokineospora xionganensis]
MAPRQVSDTRVIDAPAAEIFELLADPAKHPLIDGSGTVLSARGTGSRRLKLGDKFGMDMKMGRQYKILNTVVEFEENRLIAWRHFYGHRWRWQLRDLGDGRTEVTETFDWSTARIGFLLELVKFPGKNLKSIRATLDRLQQRFAG